MGVPPLFEDDFRYKLVPIRDHADEDIKQYLDDCCDFIDEALAQNGRVKIHCLMGASRSAT